MTPPRETQCITQAKAFGSFRSALRDLGGGAGRSSRVRRTSVGQRRRTGAGLGRSLLAPSAPIICVAAMSGPYLD